MCMGDALRFFQYESSKIHTGIVIAYQQEQDQKVLRHVYEIDLDNRGLLWGSVTVEDIRALDSLIRSVPRGPRDPETKQAIARLKHDLNEKSGIVKFNPKLDSKSQRRLQCSISKFPNYPELLKSSTDIPQVRGVDILPSIVSGRRVRNRRVHEPDSLVLR